MATVRERGIARVRDIVLEAQAGHRARLWLFGSCARGDWLNSSEIDAGEALRPSLPADLRDPGA